jgi:hypothetical protein
MTATVLDLPVVCDLGREHVMAEPESNRITFVAGNALSDDIPGGFDLITFKSMLHDWPDAEARHLLTRASHALNPGGTLLIFERAPLSGATSLPYSLMPVLLFFRSFRSSMTYCEHLQALGFQEIGREEITLDSPFVILTARLMT